MMIYMEVIDSHMAMILQQNWGSHNKCWVVGFFKSCLIIMTVANLYHGNIFETTSSSKMIKENQSLVSVSSDQICLNIWMLKLLCLNIILFKSTNNNLQQFTFLVEKYHCKLQFHPQKDYKGLFQETHMITPKNQPSITHHL